ncbi:MAG: hypothetical protein E6I93_16650 [Chloroflexi bacterium]|nr:MAG: hypothetical protein E6I93_16650 [Chloroflexota bacterium]
MADGQLLTSWRLITCKAMARQADKSGSCFFSASMVVFLARVVHYVHEERWEHVALIRLASFSE